MNIRERTVFRGCDNLQFVTRRDFLQRAALSGVSLSSLPDFVESFEDHDVVILGGRVIDPASRHDAVKNVGVRAGRIVSITSSRIKGKKEFDAHGLVVCPGFIDPISHGQNIENDQIQVLDGVTTKLQLESGVPEVDQWYRDQDSHRACNYGTGAGHFQARKKVLGNEDAAATQTASDKQIDKICNDIRNQMTAGALALGFGLEYSPQSTRMEVIKAFGIAGEFGASCHCHVRYGTVDDDASEVVGIAEVMAAAVASGAGLHIVHVPSMGLSRTTEALELVERAHAKGFDVTCDFYPYTAFGTGIATEVFAEGWQKRFGISYGDLEWAKTHERLTEESFRKYQKEGGMVLAHAIPESAIVAALRSPSSMVGSDGGLEDGVGHPRSSGTFARILGRYVREQHIVPLATAIEKMTLRAALRLEHRCPDFKRKGRVQRGCDADIVVFDPDTVKDNATFDEPAKTSTGIETVLVSGEPIVVKGALIEGARPGKPLRAKRG